MSGRFKAALFLFAILITSLVLRLFQLGSIPNGLTVDEADMAYNAYSVLRTGKDVYNKSFPLFFQSLDDFKPGIPIYLSIPSIYMLGLNEYSARLGPALVGALTPILGFFLMRVMFKRSKNIAVLLAIMLTFAPWNIAISRATFMYIELIAVYLLSLIFFFLGINKNIKFITIAAILLGVSLYIYYPALIYLPFLLLLATVIYWKNLIANKKIVLISLLALIVVSIPAAKHYLNSQSQTRFNAISIFTPDISLPLSIKETTADLQNGDKLLSVFHNRRFVFTNVYLNNYFDYFNLDYLFVNSNNIRYFYTNWVGLLYLIEILLLLSGLIYFIKNKSREGIFLFGLIVIAPIPAAFTLGSPFPHRAILLLLAIQIVCAVGFQNVLDRFRNKKRLFLLPFTLTYLFFVLLFLHQYFVHNKSEFATENDNGAWFSSVREAIKIAQQSKESEEQIIFSWPKTKTVPGIYYLFYNSVEPQLVQQLSSKNETISFKELYKDLYSFKARPINWNLEEFSEDKIYVVYKDELPRKDFDLIGWTLDSTGSLNYLIIKPI